MVNRGRTHFVSRVRRVTVNAKISESESEKLRDAAKADGMSVTGLLGLLARGVVNGEISVKNGEIKTCPTTDKKGVSEGLESDILADVKYLRLDKLVEAFREIGYSDEEIREDIERITIMVKENR